MMRPILLILCAAAMAHADTVTTTDHLSVNGTLKQMSGGVITLDASYSKGTTTLSIQLNAVESIGFNSTTFNPGAPPKDPRINARKGSTPSSQQPAVVTIVLRGNQSKDCSLLSIDANTVHCAGKGGGDYNRKTVLRLLVGAP